ncbi:MAG: S-methyl-5-thioribose-1-phosphate isomerase [Bacteroidales bacterium]|jgi:methylthioribose-1-phosphate isomerase
MKVEGKHYQTIWFHPSDRKIIRIINQQLLPFRFETMDLTTPDDVFVAVRDMYVRGAPLIGAAGAAGMYLAGLQLQDNDDCLKVMHDAAEKLKTSRPTAINLAYAIDEVMKEVSKKKNPEEIQEAAYRVASVRIEKEREYCRRIGEHGLEIIREMSKKKRGEAVNILTHCNAGWLACIDYGTATAPIYMAHDAGIKVHVWVDETRPRNQGSRLTAWELGQHGVPYTIIADNTGGHLMQHGMVDLALVGSDRTTRTGDVANKIGTYLKALAAQDNHVPFYVALPSSSFDLALKNGIREIPIEQRPPEELTRIQGIRNNEITEVGIVPEGAGVANYGFDVTPARLVTALITERGICAADEKSITTMFSDLIDG